MAELTQHFDVNHKSIKIYNILNYYYLLIFAVVLCTLGILNANIEQEVHNVSRLHTPQKTEFLKYFRLIKKPMNRKELYGITPNEKRIGAEFISLD